MKNYLVELMQLNHSLFMAWLVDCRLKANCPLMGPGSIEDVPSVLLEIKNVPSRISKVAFSYLQHPALF